MGHLEAVHLRQEPHPFLLVAAIALSLLGATLLLAQQPSSSTFAVASDDAPAQAPDAARPEPVSVYEEHFYPPSSFSARVFDVPPGAEALDVSMWFTNGVAATASIVLLDPDGNEMLRAEIGGANVIVGVASRTNQQDLTILLPAAGTWTVEFSGSGVATGVFEGSSR